MTATALAITRHILPLRCCGQRGATHHSGMVVAQPCSLAFVGLRAFVNLVRGSATVWERSGLSAPQPHSKVPQGLCSSAAQGSLICWATVLQHGTCSPEVTTTKWKVAPHFTCWMLDRRGECWGKSALACLLGASKASL